MYQLPRNFKRLLLWLVFVLPISIHAQSPQVLSGVVQRVIDGDTLVLMESDQSLRTLRLAGIDAPERRMPYGEDAKRMLSALISGKNVQATATKLDRYGRTIATVYLHGGDINLALIQQGWAWHYKAYANEQPSEEADAYARAETLAKLRKLGIWQSTVPIPPWEWRHKRGDVQAKTYTTVIGRQPNVDLGAN